MMKRKSKIKRQKSKIKNPLLRPWQPSCRVATTSGVLFLIFDFCLLIFDLPFAFSSGAPHV